MKEAIGYRRVSTREQGRSGLGLAAQHHDIEIFAAREGFAIGCWYQDIQTGAGKDALLLRPGLASALKEARARRCPLIVSRLDRLSRLPGLPVAVRDFCQEPLAAPAAAAQSGHVGAGSGLVDEDQACAIKQLLIVFPARPCRRHVDAILLAGVNAFF